MSSSVNIEEAAELIWNEAREGRYFPEALRGKLSLDDALRVQLGVLERKLAAGDRLAGWKVGLTSARVRQKFGSEERPFGHLMVSGLESPGEPVALRGVVRPSVEPELCFLVGRALKGPGVTPEQAREAMASVCPAFELNENRAGDVADFPLAVADNLSQWGLVTGAPIQPLPRSDVLGMVEMTLRLDNAVRVKAPPGEEIIDDHYLSLSILANRLAEYGHGLEPGQRVITGAFGKEPVAPGQRWEATFSAVGSVEVVFR